MINRCKYDSLRDELLRDKLVVGIRDRELSEKLQMNNKLTKKTIQRIQQAERIKEQNKVIRQDISREVDRVQRQKIIMHNRKPSIKPLETGRSKSRRCTRCAADRNHPFFKCPANKAKCIKCQRIGHFGKCCRSQRRIGEIKETESSEESCDETMFEVESISINNVWDCQRNDPWTIGLKVNNETVSFKIDAGADETILSVLTYEKLKQKPELKKTKVRLEDQGRGKEHALKVMGMVELPIENSLMEIANIPAITSSNKGRTVQTI